MLKEIGFRLKMTRIKRNLTQAQVGELVDMSEHRISEIENGRCNITLKSLNKILNVLNIDFIKWFESP